MTDKGRARKLAQIEKDLKEVRSQSEHNPVAWLLIGAAWQIVQRTKWENDQPGWGPSWLVGPDSPDIRNAASSIIFQLAGDYLV